VQVNFNLAKPIYLQRKWTGKMRVTKFLWPSLYFVCEACCRANGLKENLSPSLMGRQAVTRAFSAAKGSEGS